MSYEVQEIDTGTAGVFTYHTSDKVTLAVMFSHHVNNPGKFKVEAYREEKNAEPDLYCEMNYDNPWTAEDQRRDHQVGAGLKAYVEMSAGNSPTLVIEIAPIQASSE